MHKKQACNVPACIHEAPGGLPIWCVNKLAHATYRLAWVQLVVGCLLALPSPPRSLQRMGCVFLVYYRIDQPMPLSQTSGYWSLWCSGNSLFAKDLACMHAAQMRLQFFCTPLSTFCTAQRQLFLLKCSAVSIHTSSH